MIAKPPTKRKRKGISPNVSFRLGLMAVEVAELTRDGETLSGTAQEGLAFHLATLKASLLEVDLAEPEALLVVDACNGLFVEPHSVDFLWAQISDAIRLDGLDEKWHVDGPTLVEKARGWTYAQNLAVQIAAKKWWLICNDGEYGETLRRVGLVR